MSMPSSARGSSWEFDPQSEIREVHSELIGNSDRGGFTGCDIARAFRRKSRPRGQTLSGKQPRPVCRLSLSIRAGSLPTKSRRDAADGRHGEEIVASENRGKSNYDDFGEVLGSRRQALSAPAKPRRNLEFKQRLRFHDRTVFGEGVKRVDQQTAGPDIRLNEAERRRRQAIGAAE